MQQFKTVIDLFGEPVELRASTLPGEKIPISCFLAGGGAISDVAFIRPFDGLIEYDDVRMLAAVEDVRRRRSMGFNLFFLVAKPILFLIDLVLAFLRGMGRFFGSMSIFGFFSVAIGVFALMAIVLTLGAMAMVLVYALPVVAVAYGVKAAYESGSKGAVTRMKTACQSLSGMVARGGAGEAEAGNGVVIDATSEDVTPAPSASPPVLAAPAVAESGRLQGQLAKGLMIGLVIGIPGAAIVAFLPALQNQTPTTTTTTTQQVPAPVPAPKREQVAAPLPEAPPKPEVRSGSVEVVVDTATLTVGGQPVRLAGLVPVQIPEAKAAAQAYLRQAGPVRCEALPTGAWRCVVPSKGLDVAEVFALSGFAKADVDAPEFIRAAEAMARENRRGIWGAS
ncbi:MAG: hypothetical protein AB1918_05575 [Pseudomonadota bacterium]